MKTSFEQVVDEFVDQCDKVYGMYLDSTEGLKLILKDRKATHGPYPNEDLELHYIYAEEQDDFQPTQHIVTYSDFLKRNEMLGLNLTLLAQSCIVLIYGYWEDHYRSKIANSLNLAHKDDVKIPFMNELRYLRRDIIHHRGVVTAETANKVSFHATEGSRIEFSDGEFYLLILSIKSAVKEFRL